LTEDSSFTGNPGGGPSGLARNAREVGHPDGGGSASSAFLYRLLRL
jgi:hypothetical protein